MLLVLTLIAAPLALMLKLASKEPQKVPVRIEIPTRRRRRG